MKLNKKLLLVFSGIFLFFSVALILFEVLFIDKFYIYQKKNTLFGSYAEIKDYIENSPSITNEEILRKMKDISISNGCETIFFDSNGINIDPSSLEDDKISDLSELRFSLEVDGEVIIVDTKEEYERYLKSDGQVSNFVFKPDSQNKNIAIIGKVSSNENIIGYAFVFTSYTAIKENTNIFVAFSSYLSILLFVISLIIIFFVSNKISKPLKDAEEKTRMIANMDFSTKLEVNGEDEISNLAVSINKMSDELEKNIQKLKEANLKLEEDIKLKEEINTMRREFISDVSHELKTPISIISGYSEALKLEGASKEEISEYADIIIDESKKMNKLVKDLLKYSQIESGFIELNNEEFELLDLINNCIKPNELKFKESNTELINNVSSIIAIGDYDALETVMNNYVGNAINHVKEVNNRKYIEISSEMLNDKLRVYVKNSGNNIPEDNIKYIWDAFYKVDKARSREYGGTGLGLSIVKSLMTAYKNDFGVLNEEDGVKFFFDINIAKKKD